MLVISYRIPPVFFPFISQSVLLKPTPICNAPLLPGVVKGAEGKNVKKKVALQSSETI